MLGHPSVHEPLKGTFAKELQSKLWRITTNNLNDEDKKELADIRHRNKNRRYNIIWED